MRSFLLVSILLLVGVASGQTPPSSPAMDASATPAPAAPSAPASVAPAPAVPSVADAMVASPPSVVAAPPVVTPVDAAVSAPPSVVAAPPSTPPAALPSAPLPVEEGTPAGAWAAWISGGVVLLLGIWLAVKKFWAAKPAAKL